MYLRSFVLAAVLLSVAQVFGQATTSEPPLASSAPATAAQEQAKLQELTQRHAQEQLSSQGRIDLLNGDLAKLRGDVERLAKDAKGMEDLKQALQATTARITTLEAIDAAKRSQQDLTARQQYETGFRVLQIMRQSMLKLDFTVKLAKDVNNFQALLNPASNDAFKAAVTDLQGTNRDEANRQLALGGKLLANPYVSLAWSVVSVFLTNARPASRVAKFNNVICVVNAATVADAPTRIVATRLDDLSRRIAAFNRRANDAFLPYVSVVDYRSPIAVYEEELRVNSGVDPLDARITTFFASDGDPGKKTARNAEAMTSLRYQVGEVILLLNEYDAILEQMNAFLAAFVATVSDYRRDIKLDCAGMSQVQTALVQLEERAKALPTDFTTAYSKDIATHHRRALYGGR